MREVTEKMRMTARKYITRDWKNKYGFLEPFEIDEEKIEETTNGIYLKCRCHFPGCPTMQNPDHPYVSVRTNKLNGKTQVSCGACAKKARQLDEYKFEEIKVGSTIGCWHIDEELNDKELKQRMGWTGHSKYFKAHCIYCGLTDYKCADHLKVGAASCVCKSGSSNEKRINSLLKRILEGNEKYTYMAEYGLDKLRVDFAILDKSETPVLFIEYDGEFHDQSEMHKGELQGFKERDALKNSRAEELGVPLIRITYKEQNLITESWLKEQINKYLTLL